MRDSADSYDPAYGRVRRAKNKRQRKYYDDEATFAKRDQHRERPQAEDAGDAVDGLPEGDRWSTWDQSEILVPSDLSGLRWTETDYRSRR